jgi:hypothetical protein
LTAPPTSATVSLWILTRPREAPKKKPLTNILGCVIYGIDIERILRLYAGGAREFVFGGFLQSIAK